MANNKIPSTMLSGGLRTKGIIKQSQENLPLITVVTVVRNGEDTLEETILSVINQTYENVEYLIIDGASTDNTLDIIKKYEDKIDYWISETDNGIYYAMNKGIDLAAGEWINFMNSGDRFYTNEILYKIQDCFKNPDIDVVYGDCIYDYNKLNLKIYSSAGNIEKLYKNMPFCHQSSFIKISIIKNYKFDCRYKVAADYAFFFELFKDGYIFQYIPVTISIYIRDGISESIETYKERSYINGTKKNFKYFYMLLFIYLRKSIKCILPKILFIIYYKILNNINTNSCIYI